MNTYQRLFGAGPRGALLSLVLLVPAATLPLSPIHSRPGLGWLALGAGASLAAALVIWSLKSLPPTARGRALVQTGAFAHFRHPLYAAGITLLAPGLALWLDDWSYAIWATALHPLWHWNIRAEERLMAAEFGEDYRDYCRRTGRFWPRRFH